MEMEPNEKEVTIIIDGTEVKTREGTYVLEAARQIGIDIPTLCYHSALSPFGACRLCSVEITNRQGKKRIVTSCNYLVEEGLAVDTKSEKVKSIRRMLMELLLSRCPRVPRLKKLAQMYGVQEPTFWVVDEEEDCILCGLCTRVCSELIGVSAINFAKRGVEREVVAPYHEFSDDCIGCRACTMVCPTASKKLRIHTYATVGSLQGAKEEHLGVCSDIFSARSSVEGQDGGVATALLISGFKRGLFDTAIVVQRKEGYTAEAVIADNTDEIMKARGTKYLRVKMMSKLAELIDKGNKKIAFVGIPCQVRAARKIQQILQQDFPTLEITLIGLFCYEAFDYKKLKEETKRLLDVDLDKSEKTQIQKGKFIVQVNGKEYSCKVKELNDAIEKGCLYCNDFPALFADISVGSVGSEAGFSTVIVRTKRGEKLLEKLSFTRGGVEKKEIAKLSLSKRNRAKKNFGPILKEIYAHRLRTKRPE
jgi:coenzyme F420-reducing hydrogenase beta subunit